MVILRALRALRGCEQTRAHPNDRLILDVATLSPPPPGPPPPAEWNRSEDSGEAGGGENIKGGRGRLRRPLPPLSSIPLSAQFLCTESRDSGGEGGRGVRARAQGGNAPGCMATRCAFCSPFDMFTAIQEADSLVAHGEGLTASEVRRRTGNGIGLTLSIRSEKWPQALATA